MDFVGHSPQTDNQRRKPDFFVRFDVTGKGNPKRKARKAKKMNDFVRIPESRHLLDVLLAR